MPTLRYVVVDVFTDTALAGNQLAVFTDAREVDADLMQALALEIGYSETTFVLPAEQGGTARIRIFTPFVELPFAGHPILGTAWVLGQPLERSVIELETGMGMVPGRAGSRRVRSAGLRPHDSAGASHSSRIPRPRRSCPRSV